MKVHWTDAAAAHLEAIHAYIAQDSPRYALAMIDRITHRSEKCGQFPLMGARVPEYELADVREVFEYPVIHGARQLPKKLP